MALFKISYRINTTPNAREVLEVHFNGTISSITSYEFQQELAAIDISERPVIVNLSGISYMNSSSLGELAILCRKLRKAGHAPCVVGMRPTIFKLILLLGLDRYMELFEETNEALMFIDNTHAVKDHDERITIMQKCFSANRYNPLDESDKSVAFFVLESTPLAKALKDEFSKSGTKIISGKSYSEIIKKSKNEKIDYLIADIAFPDYFALCKDLATLNERLHVIQVTQPAQGPGEQKDSSNLNGVISVDFFSEEGAATKAQSVCEKISANCGLSDEKQGNLFFAVREAMDNSCGYGNLYSPHKLIQVVFIISPSEVVVEIEDEGVGFDYNEWLQMARENNPIEQAQKRLKRGYHGGLGINLITRCCDEVEYIYPGNKIRMTIYK